MKLDSRKKRGSTTEMAAGAAARRSQPAEEEIVGAECREQSRPLAEGEVFSLDIPFNRTADKPFAHLLATAKSVTRTPHEAHFLSDIQRKTANACSRSAIKSPVSSNPMLNRIRRSP